MKEVNSIEGEVISLENKLVKIERDILKVWENLDFIKEQNIAILSKISTIEERDKFPNLRTTEAIENISKKLNNIEKPTQDLDNIINKLNSFKFKKYR